jgi:hypothetical protein
MERPTMKVVIYPYLIIHSWMMTAQKDYSGNFINKKAVRPACQVEVITSCELFVTI